LSVNSRLLKLGAESALIASAVSKNSAVDKRSPELYKVLPRTNSFSGSCVVGSDNSLGYPVGYDLWLKSHKIAYVQSVLDKYRLLRILCAEILVRRIHLVF